MNNPADGDLTAALTPCRRCAYLLKAWNMRARKSLGQNFLFDLNLTRKIARSAGPLTGTTIEIGPGPGGLTRALLLEHAAHVIAIEKDRRASAVLSSLSVAAGDRLTLIEADALTSPIWELGTAPRRIIANLPYNIATTLLIQWLAHANCFELDDLDVSARSCRTHHRPPRRAAYGRLSVLTRWLADAEILFDVPASAFVPPPKITSSIVQIVPLSTPPLPLFATCLRIHHTHGIWPAPQNAA